MIVNKKSGNFPYVLHSPTDSILLAKYKEFQQVCKPVFNLPDSLEIVTFNNKEKPCLLEECLLFTHLPHTVLGRGIQWVNTLKIPLMIEFLEKCQKPYILSIDGFDAIITKDLFDIVDKFKTKKCKMLFNATCYQWPPVKRKFLCDSLYKNTKIPFNYLNAGVWIGERDYCLEFFKEAAKQTNQEYPESEQILIKSAADNFSDYDLDVESEFFQLIQVNFMSNIAGIAVKLL